MPRSARLDGRRSRLWLSAAASAKRQQIVSAGKSSTDDSELALAHASLRRPGGSYGWAAHWVAGGNRSTRIRRAARALARPDPSGAARLSRDAAGPFTHA